MSTLDEIADIKRRIEEAKIKRARLQERLEANKREKERLLEEARTLGISDPSKLSAWVKDKEQKFTEMKDLIVALLEGAGV